MVNFSVVRLACEAMRVLHDAHNVTISGPDNVNMLEVLEYMPRHNIYVTHIARLRGGGWTMSLERDTTGSRLAHG